jgi:hypothetical protein
LRTGYKIHHNIIANVGLEMTESWQGGGIGSNNKDPMEVYNNVIVNADHGFGAGVNTSGTAQGKYYNNMVINPRSKGTNAYMSFISPATPTNLDVDNNLFYPQTIMTQANGFTMYPSVPHNAHSVFADPQFVSAALAKISDFALKATSPAIDMGKNADIAKDIIGTSIPQGAAPDIGAFEYSAPIPTFSNADLNQDNSVNLTDFNILKTDFLKLAASLANPRSDIDGDGQATIKDVGILMSGWK